MTYIILDFTVTYSCLYITMVIYFFFTNENHSNNLYIPVVCSYSNKYFYPKIKINNNSFVIIIIIQLW